MKVIGTGANGSYLCEVSHTELEKMTDKYFGKLERLTVGSEMDLGAGYDFRSGIKQACVSMLGAVKDFNASQSTLHQFAVMVRDLPDGDNS